MAPEPLFRIMRKGRGNGVNVQRCMACMKKVVPRSFRPLAQAFFLFQLNALCKRTGGIFMDKNRTISPRDRVHVRQAAHRQYLRDRADGCDRPLPPRTGLWMCSFRPARMNMGRRSKKRQRKRAFTPVWIHPELCFQRNIQEQIRSVRERSASLE